MLYANKDSQYFKMIQLKNKKNNPVYNPVYYPIYNPIKNPVYSHARTVKRNHCACGMSGIIKIVHY